MSDFISLGISERVVTKLLENGITIPTPIQSQAIPLILNGEDIIAQAQTGTGKTFAFVLPILERLERDSSHIQALIITPTRELAIQITTEIKNMISDLEGIEVLAVYGGQDVEKQLNKLKRNVQIVVGTPGRLLDHIRRETIGLDKTSYLVLDEADQMLHIGFLDEVEKIINMTPASRQTMLFSATMPTEIRKLANKQMRKPKYLQVEKIQGPAQTVKQQAIYTTDRGKQGTLIDLIHMHRPFLAVVFCRTKRRVSKLYEALQSQGFPCDELHGDLSQAKREQVMKRFRDAEIQLLVATDVAARGLDVEGVTHVYNYDIPQDSESYIHRIGRTGRAGMTGMAITLYSSKDQSTLEKIEKELNILIQKHNTEMQKNTKDGAKKKKEGSEPRNAKLNSSKNKPKTGAVGKGRKKTSHPNSPRQQTKRSKLQSKRSRNHKYS